MFTTAIVMSCDAVEQTGDNCITTCYILQTKLRKSPLRSELLFLALYVEKLKPKFSAAGFYQVNQLILAGIFSVVITYAIICIQFNS